jgi:hypothetical protein
MITPDSDIRIAYTIRGKHPAAWRAKVIADLEKRGVNNPGRDDDGQLRRAHHPDAIRKAADESPVQAMQLGSPTDQPMFARQRARQAIAAGATDVTISYTVHRLDVPTQKWAKVGGGTLMLDSDFCPQPEDFAARESVA